MQRKEEDSRGETAQTAVEKKATERAGTRRSKQRSGELVLGGEHTVIRAETVMLSERTRGLMRAAVRTRYLLAAC